MHNRETVLDLPERENVVKKPDSNLSRDRIDLRADPEWVVRVEAMARRFGLSLSAYIRLAVSERVERDEAAVIRRPKSKA